MQATATNLTIRSIQQTDNQTLASIVRTTLDEFAVPHEGTVYTDPTTDDLYALFQKKGSAYFVAELDGKMVGGGGIYPTDGLPADTCELVKMYLLTTARGLGLGRTLIQKCIDTAAEKGYRNIYLESMPQLKKALATYEHFGFEYLPGPVGNSGHFGCGLWMMRSLGH